MMKKKSWVDRALQDERLAAQQLLCLRYPLLRGLPLEDVIRITSSSSSSSSSSALLCDQIARRKRSKRALPNPSPSSRLGDVNDISSSDPAPSKKRIKTASPNHSPSSELDCKIPPSSSPLSPAVHEGSSDPSKNLESGWQVYEHLKIKINIRGLTLNEERTPEKRPRAFILPDLNLPCVPSEEDQDS